MMRERYESLSLTVLRDLAKARGIKKFSTLRKPELVKVMLEADELDAAAARQRKAALKERGEDAVNAADPAYEPVSLSAGAEYVPNPNVAIPSISEENVYRSLRQADDQQSSRSAKSGSGHPASRYNSSRFGSSSGRTSSYPSGGYAGSVYPNGGSNGAAYEADKGEYPSAASSASSYLKGSVDEQQKLQAVQEQDRSGYDADAAQKDDKSLDSGVTVSGILEVMADGFGFIRSNNYMPGENDVYVSPSQIRRFSLRTGDVITGNTRVKSEKEKFSALLYVSRINGRSPAEVAGRKSFEKLTPIFPNERIHLERPGCSVAMRIVDLVSPIGKGQRGMIVSQPKAGKTTLLKDIAKSVLINNPQMRLIILLIDERPEEVTDIREAIQGENVEVISSTFDELPEHHKRVSEMVIERAKRLVEQKQDVMILLDSITRLARAYNLTVPPSGRTLSGGLDPAALHMPKRFFGAARNMREGGSLTILATALVETGSKMDDVVYEEFKGTGNMELVLDRKLSERRIFPAVDIVKSGTRREDLLMSPEELSGMDNVRKAINGMRSDEAVENVLNMFTHTRTNADFINIVQKNRIL